MWWGGTGEEPSRSSPGTSRKSAARVLVSPWGRRQQVISSAAYYLPRNSNSLLLWSFLCSSNAFCRVSNWKQNPVMETTNPPLGPALKRCTIKLNLPHLTFRWPYIVMNFYNKNQLDAPITQIFIWNKTLHVSDSSSVHHQEFFTVHTAMVYVIHVCWQLASRIRTELLFRSDPARKLSANMYDIYHCCVYSEKLLMMDRGTIRNV